VPFTVSVKSGEPAIIEVGFSEIVVGIGFMTVVTVNAWLFEVPPPGAGFVTVTGTVPVAATSIAGIMARSVVLEMKVVVAASPLKFTTEPEMKFAPFTVSVKSELPAGVEVGLIDEVVGIGFITVKVFGFDVPPPGIGFVTVIKISPPAARSESRISTVSVVFEMKVVPLSNPSNWIPDVGMNPVPVSVSVKPALPAAVEVEERAIRVGTGFDAVVTVKVWLFEVPPPGAGFVTVTGNVPVAATSAATIVAVISVEETNEVVRGEPFQFTTEPEMKFAPFTVSVKSELPAVVEVGKMEVVVGTGFSIVKVVASELAA
jgi:hypothetical protein